jgi:hypothetical protein
MAAASNTVEEVNGESCRKNDCTPSLKHRALSALIFAFSVKLEPMSAPLVPSPLDYIGLRRFAFYPAIKNIQPNEWLLGTGSWSEVQVVNAQTGAELWIPRQYVGAVSETEGPLLIVGLTKDLEVHGGTVEPSVKVVIEMPHVEECALKTEGELSRRTAGPAPVIGIRLPERSDSSMNKALVTLAIGALVVCLLAALIAAAAKL